MNNSIWKLATLAGVVGIGVLVVLQFQRGLDGHIYKQPEALESLTEEEWLDESSRDAAAPSRSEDSPRHESFDDFGGAFGQSEPAPSASGGDAALAEQFSTPRPSANSTARRTAEDSPFYGDDPFSAPEPPRDSDSAANSSAAADNRAQPEAATSLFPTVVEVVADDAAPAKRPTAGDDDPFVSKESTTASQHPITLASHTEPAPFEDSFGEGDDESGKRAAPPASSDPFDFEPTPRRLPSRSGEPAMLFLDDNVDGKVDENGTASDLRDADDPPHYFGPQRPQPLALPASDADPFGASFGSDEAQDKPAQNPRDREDDAEPPFLDPSSNRAPRFDSDAFDSDTFDREEPPAKTPLNAPSSDDPFGEAMPIESRREDSVPSFGSLPDENAESPRKTRDLPPRARIDNSSSDANTNAFFGDSPSAAPAHNDSPEPELPAESLERERDRDDEFLFGEPNPAMNAANSNDTNNTGNTTDAADDFGGPALPNFGPTIDPLPSSPNELPRGEPSFVDEARDDETGAAAHSREPSDDSTDKSGGAAMPVPSLFDDEPPLPETDSAAFDPKEDEKVEEAEPSQGRDDASVEDAASPRSGLPAIDKPARPSERPASPSEVGDTPSVRPQRFEPPPDANRLRSRVIEDLDGDGTVSADSPAGAQRPQLKIEKSAPPNARLGEPLIYSVLVTNVGDSTAHQVVVEDRIPRGSKLTGTIPQAELIEKRLVWRIGDLAPGEEKKILIRVIPVAAGPIGSVATVNFVAEVAAKTVVTSPRLDVKVSAPEQARLGEPVVLRFTVANLGSADATGVIVRDIVPDNLRHPGGNDLEYEIGDLPAGESREVKLTLSSVSPGLAVNRAIITADGGLTAEAGAEINIVGASLQITRTGPSSRLMQTRGVYSNVISNETSVPIENAQVVETIPRGMEFVEASHGGTYDEASRTVSWNIDRLEAKQRQTLRITLLPRELGTQVSAVSAFDAEGNEVEAVSQTKVVGFAALAGGIGGVDRPIAVGERAVFQLRIRNRGSKAATNVNASLIVPDELQVISPNSPRDRLRAGRIDFAPLSHVDPGDEIKLQVVMKAAAAGDARLELHLQSDEMQRPLKHEEALLIYSLDADVPRLEEP